MVAQLHETSFQDPIATCMYLWLDIHKPYDMSYDPVQENDEAIAVLLNY